MESDVLQWGRRNSPAETYTNEEEMVADLDASMGPPEFTGGNIALYGMSAQDATRFNGAAGIHRRKPPLYVAENCACRARFNGAAGIHRRKRVQRAYFRGSADSASMGPPEFTGGNVDWISNINPFKWLGLQWGRRNSPAETRLAHQRARERLIGLQWGRRNSPAETNAGRTATPVGIARFNGAAGIHRRKRGGFEGAAHETRRASMGPPEFTGGNSRSARRKDALLASLQWGRRNSPAETHHHQRRAAAGGSRFNGAAGIHRRKPTTSGQRQALSGARFNGAAGIHRRKPR